MGSNPSAAVNDCGDESSYLSTIKLFKEDMKFSAGHFTIFGPNNRERLHGHNFGVQLSITAPTGDNGMIADYNVYKKAVRKMCDAFDELMLLPGLSPHLKIVPFTRHDEHGRQSENVTVIFGGKQHGNENDSAADEFVFPAADVLVLPLRNITLEELSKHLASCLVEEHAETMRLDKIQSLVVTVSSGPGQTAEFSMKFNDAAGRADNLPE